MELNEYKECHCMKNGLNLTIQYKINSDLKNRKKNSRISGIFIVKKGSSIKKEMSPYFKKNKPQYYNLLQELIENKIIVNDVFQKDYKFDNLSVLGSVCQKSSSNGQSLIDEKFLNNNEQMSSHKTQIQKHNSNSENLVEYYINSELSGYIGTNTIFYGVPGCGKSYYIKNLLKYEDGQDIDKKFYKRILFHPEYTYSDFVGQIMPESDENKISYNFQAGPFVEIVKDALKDKNNQYFLIIEEINRGNAPAIFGDIFQLLDRDNGESEYKIYNKEIITWLNNQGIKDISQLYIPRNLTIFATMNTSDQNVFIIDTAFKRRWRMHRIENNFENANNPILTKNIILNNKHIHWKDLAIALNKDIIKNCNDGTIAEDKLLGTNFVKLSDLADIQQFAEKIFMYLWNDVVKYNKEQLFKATYKLLDDIIKDFVDGKYVFNDNCENMKKLYELENFSINGNNNE